MLLTDRSAKAAKLASPLARLSLPRTASATSAGGPVAVAGTATSKLTFLCSSAGLIEGNPLLGLLGLSNLIACP